MKSWVFILIMFLSFGSNASEVGSEATNGAKIATDLKTAYYWAFYGKYSKDPRVLGDVLSRLADIDSRIYDVTKEQSYNYYRKLVNSQGGPQLLLAQLGGKRLLAAELMGLNTEVDKFVSAVFKLNPQYGASLYLLGSGFNIPSSYEKARQHALPANPADIEKCLVSCGIHFLGLEKNPLLFPGLRSNGPMSEAEVSKHKNQINGLFPQYSKGNGEPLQIRRGVDPRVANISNQCVSACTEILSDNVIKLGSVGGGAGAVLGGVPMGAVAGAVAGGIIGVSVGALQCSTSKECGVSRETEIAAEKAAKIKAENDLRDEILRADRLKNEEREHREEQRRNREREEQKRDSERAQKNEERIKESFDQKNNGKKNDDSSVECERLKSCDETMNAFRVPEGYIETKTGSLDDLNEQKDWNVLRANADVGNSKETDLAKTDYGLDSTPMPEEVVDSSGEVFIKDAQGNILTKTDLSGTPMPGSDDKQYDFDFSGQGRKANPVVPVFPGKLGGW